MMTKNMLMKKLMALDFMAVDLALFLDTHPNDKEAIETYSAIVKEGKKARNEYENEFGPLRTTSGVCDGKWCWADDPWPWQNEANICTREED